MGAENDPGKNIDKRKAVWLLAHMVGDIHQPLHVGAIYFNKDCDKIVDPDVVGAGQADFSIGDTIGATAGGNSLKTGKTANMHSYWDSSTVDGAIRKAGLGKHDWNGLAARLVKNAPDSWQTSGPPDTWAAQWATEILPLADEALIKRLSIGEGEPGTSHGKLQCTVKVERKRGYVGWAYNKAGIQLAKAGYRLAAILVAVSRNSFKSAKGLCADRRGSPNAMPDQPETWLDHPQVFCDQLSRALFAQVRYLS